MKNYSSIRNKFVLLLIILVILAVSVNTWLHIQSSLQARQEEMEARAIALGEFIGLEFVDQFLKETDTEEANQHMKFWVNQVSDAVFLSVYNTDGESLFKHSKKNYSIPKSNQINKTFIQNLINSDLRITGRKIPQSEIYEMLIPVTLFDAEIGVVRLGLDGYRLQNDQSEIIITNIQYGSALLLFITLLGYFLTPYLVKPLEALENVAAEFGKGNLDARAEIETRDEIQELATQFNSMADRLQKQITSLEDIEKLYNIFPYILSPNLLSKKIIDQLSESLRVSNVALFLVDEDQKLIQQTMTDQARDLYKNLEFLENSFQKFASNLDELSNLDKESSTNSRIKRKRKFSEIKGINVTPREIQDLLIFQIGKGHCVNGYIVLAREDIPFGGSDINFSRTLIKQIETVIHNARLIRNLLTNSETGLLRQDVMQTVIREVGNVTENISAYGGILEIKSNDSGNESDQKISEETFNAYCRTLVRILDGGNQEYVSRNEGIIIGHYKKNSLLILFVDFDVNKLQDRVENLLQTMHAESGEDIRVIYKMGISTIPDGIQGDDLLQKINEQLDKAKLQGGDAVCTVT